MGKKQDKERLQMLARLGRETIIKYGTYDVDDVRKIDSDHPEKYEEERRLEREQREAEERAEEEQVAQAKAAEAQAAAEPISEEDASSLAEQILSSNFKVGMSQSDVDAFLNGMV